LEGFAVKKLNRYRNHRFCGERFGSWMVILSDVCSGCLPIRVLRIAPRNGWAATFGNLMMIVNQAHLRQSWITSRSAVFLENVYWLAAHAHLILVASTEQFCYNETGFFLKSAAVSCFHR
jgi:hypothetical protein